jgi:L-lactate dehydrogenase complex protein LldF
VRLDIPRMLLSLRRDSAPSTAPVWLRTAMRMFGWATRRPRVYGVLTGMARKALRTRARRGWVARLPGPGAAWSTSRDLPAPARRSFVNRWRRERGAP